MPDDVSSLDQDCQRANDLLGHKRDLLKLGDVSGRDAREFDGYGRSVGALRSRYNHRGAHGRQNWYRQIWPACHEGHQGRAARTEIFGMATKGLVSKR